MSAHESKGVDVIVIGAGLSGLAAAKALKASGATVRVLEARDRVGGRLWSGKVGRGTFDFGGQWIGPTQLRMVALARELGVETFPTYSTGRKVLSLGGKMSTYAGSIPRMSPLKLVQLELSLRMLESLRKQVSTEAPWTATKADAWDMATLEDWKRRYVKSADVRATFDVAVRVVFGAEPREISFLYFLEYTNAGGGFLKLVEIEGGAQQDRLVGGAQELPRRIAAQLGDDVILGAPVQAIDDRDGEVRVHAEGREERARHVIVALPPLLAGSIHYVAGMTSAREHLAQRVPMGATTKVIATYRRPFWREAGMSGEAVSDTGPFSVVFDNCSHEGEPALLGFVVGQAARAWSALSPTARRAQATAELARLIGPEAREPIEYHEQDWSRERWTRGCPVGVMGPGTLGTLGPALREPVGRIYWAGTETATEWCGYMEGAVAAGERAAREVRSRA